jgi:hypothetical protein
MLKSLKRCSREIRSTRICGETGFDYNAGICRECAVGYFGGKCTQKCPANCNYLSHNRLTGECVQCKEGWFDRNIAYDNTERCQEPTCFENSVTKRAPKIAMGILATEKLVTACLVH